MKQITILLVIAAMIFTACNNKKEIKELQSKKDSLSYALGIDIGQSLVNQHVEELNPEILALALDKVLNGDSDLVMSKQEARLFLQNYFKTAAEKRFKENLEKGQAFLQENAKKDSVIVTESGLQYKILSQGNGPKPTIDDIVKVHYKGYLIDGKVFDTSYGRDPITFPLNKVIKGWQEALQLMPVGSKWIVYIPSELGYGQNVPPGSAIEPNSVLIFEIELLGIENQNKE